MLLADPRWFTCHGCGGTFEVDRENWSDEQALEEMRQTYGHFPEEERRVVCDDCYAKCMQEMAKEQKVLQ